MCRYFVEAWRRQAFEQQTAMLKEFQIRAIQLSEKLRNRRLEVS